MDRQGREYGRLNCSNSSPSGDVFEPSLHNNAKQRAALIEWLNSILPGLNFPVNASDEELRVLLFDGSTLCRILNKLRPGSVVEYGTPNRSTEARSENVRRFLAAMDEIGLPRFQLSDLEKGSMRIVLECLLTLKAHFMPTIGGCSPSTTTSPNKSGTDAGMRWKLMDHIGSGESSPGEVSPRTYASIVAGGGGDDRRKVGSDSKFQRALRSPIMAEPSAALIHHVGHKFHEVFQLKQGGYADIPAAKLSEMMKSNSLDLAPTQSLLSVVNGILDESIDKKNGEIPHRVACLLRKVVQEIERRISTQSEHLRTQNNLFKAREEKYQSRIKVLEALATGTNEETQVVMNHLQQIKTEKIKVDEKRKYEEQDLERLMKEKDKYDNEIATLKQELQIARKAQVEIVSLKQELEIARKAQVEIATLKQELEMARKAQIQRSSQLEIDAKKAHQEVEERLQEVLHHLMESQKRVKELESSSESISQGWKKKANMYQIVTEFQLGILRELRFSSQSVRQEILQTQKSYSDEFDHLGMKIRTLEDAAHNYYKVLSENQKLHNELQELKGNIRVYCRIRPFLPGQSAKQSIIEYIGENGELVVSNPSKQGKEGRRSFKFNKVYGPEVTQAGVFIDTQPLIQSVLDGYNVCIFAYGQTGSGKTYTMSGPDNGSPEDWGVNYRALNDLFQISRTRKGTYDYGVGVQMVEIYNEQVRDLLSTDPQKRLGILATPQANGLAVPEASMLPVNSPSDVLELMETGFKNRARGSTAMNERSSRSHSVVTIHVHGSDLKTGGSIRGSLHLVDLAGSERIDRSEATGDRLKEAQHINKSLSALGDVIFALSQKSAHVPYRNSKLTQVLQSSLGGHAKTLMFVQLNPDVASFSETLSTLKFAERVSGVELGAAKSSKEGRDVRELMEQVASLKDTIAKKDEEIERLQLLKDLKNIYPGGSHVNGEKRVPTSSLRYGSLSSPTLSRNSMGSTSQRNIKLAGGKSSPGVSEKAVFVSDPDSNYSESSENKHSPVSSQTDSLLGQKFPADHHAEMLRSFGDAENDHERLSDVSDSALSVGTDTDGSVDSNQVGHQGSKNLENTDKPKPTSKAPRPQMKSLVREPIGKVSTGLKKSASGGSLASKPVKSTSTRWS